MKTIQERKEILDAQESKNAEEISEKQKELKKREDKVSKAEKEVEEKKDEILKQLAWNVIGLEPEINYDRSRGKVRLVVLKNREHATLGVADTFSMDEVTGDFVLYKAGSELL